MRRHLTRKGGKTRLKSRSPTRNSRSNSSSGVLHPLSPNSTRRRNRSRSRSPPPTLVRRNSSRARAVARAVARQHQGYFGSD